MIRLIRIGSSLSVIAALLTFVALPGCDKPKNEPLKAKETDHNKHKEEEVEIGPHGGPCAEWDHDNYHAEFTVEHATKTVTIYVLDGTAKKAPKIAPEKITKVTVENLKTTPKVAIDLKHDPKKSDDKGIAFVGVHDTFAMPAEMTLTITGVIDGKAPPYTGSITYTPKKDNKDKSASLSLTPGGIYTAADIKANGNTTPEEKFEDKIFTHGAKAKVGDRICPISKEKADADCAWVIQGERYEFCCTPCINRLLKQAHNDPAKVKRAAEYVFKSK